MATIIAVGMCTIDRISQIDRVPPLPAKVRARAYLEDGGGMAATAAVAVARLGGTSIFWGRVGTDRAGEEIVSTLVREGVDASAVARVAGARSVTSAVIVDARGERLIIPDVDPALEGPPPLLPLERIADAGAVLCDGRWLDANAIAFQAARQQGVATVLDIEPSASEVYDRLLPLADHAVFSTAGLLAYTGAADAEAGLAIAHARLGVTVGVTLAAEGAAFLSGDSLLRLPAPKIIAVDTTGAGDAFHGAYALAVAEGMPLEACIRFANATAALKCTMLGGRRGLPDRRAVEDLLGA